jgi:hypothetical protein
MSPSRFIEEIGSLIARCPSLVTAAFESSLPDLSAEAEAVCLSDIFCVANRLGLILPLKRLELKGVAVTPDQVRAVLQQLRHIQFLGISRNPSKYATTVFGEICNVLKKEGIFLKVILTDVVKDVKLLIFLASNPGLQELILRPIHSSDNSMELVERIYTVILPRQRETLQVLKIGSFAAPRAWVTFPRAEWLNEVAKCQKLRKLQVHYEFTEQLAENFVRLQY